MTWVRSDDGEPNHPKIFRAGPAAYGFFQASKCYCARTLSDGLLPESDLALVLPGVTRGRALKLAERLVACGLFERADNGYRVHDYLDYNPSRQQVLSSRAEIRDKRAAAGRIGGLRSGEVRRNAQAAAGEAQVEQTTKQGASPVLPNDEAPLPLPLPLPSQKSKDIPAGFARFWAKFPKRVGKDAALREWSKKKCEAIADEIIAAVTAQMTYLLRDGGKYVPNPSTWLSQGRWKDEPPLVTTNGVNGYARPPQDDPRSRMPEGRRKVSFRDDSSPSVTGFARPPADDPRSKRPEGRRTISLRDEEEDPDAEVTVR